MWIGSAVLFTKHNPTDFLEQGVSPVRGVLAVGASYVAGFLLQTIIFALMDRITEPEPVPDSILECVDQLLKARLKHPTVQAPITRNELPLFCKWYVMEHSQELRNVLAEHEGDINLLVALPAALAITIAGGFWYLNATSTQPLSVALPLVALVVGWVGLGWFVYLKVREYRGTEKREACQMFFLLEMRNPDPTAKATE